MNWLEQQQQQLHICFISLDYQFKNTLVIPAGNRQIGGIDSFAFIRW